jgi:hypothetical protein
VRAGADEERPAAPLRTPDVSALLQLQRSAGNRAVVQRLLYDDKTHDVTVPKTYADKRLHWNGSEQDPKAPEKTVLEIITGGGGREHFQTGLGVGALGSVSALPDAQLGNDAAAMADPTAQAGTDAALRAAATDQYKLLHFWPQTLFYAPDEIAADLVLGPDDYLPEPSDLPKQGVSVTSPQPGQAVTQPKRRAKNEEAHAPKTYWEFMCVLIALLSADGNFAQVTQLTRLTPTSMIGAVQALHDYYMGQKVPLQYDDTSTRRKVMTEWGYALKFAGRAAWTDLPQHVALSAGGKYIFDIKDHTVHVEVLQNIDAQTQIQDPKLFFKCNSDKKNYNRDEFAQPVQYIWTRSLGRSDCGTPPPCEPACPTRSSTTGTPSAAAAATTCARENPSGTANASTRACSARKPSAATTIRPHAETIPSHQ